MNLASDPILFNSAQFSGNDLVRIELERCLMMRLAR
jgi:hypothetical protein